jgi:lysozyme family protein
MTATGYARALPRVLVHEGGYVNDPLDPGGATNKGITFRVYDGYRQRKGLPTQDVRDITAAEISDIYKLQYWDAVKGDILPAGVDYVLFDGGIMSGPSQSIKWLQRALGNVVVDGQMGQATLAAVAEHPNKPALIDAICDRRMAFLRALRTFGRFGKGWTRRVEGVREVGKSWARGLGSTPIPHDTKPTKRAPITDAKSIPGKGAADAATGGGIVTGGIGSALEAARQSLQPLTDALPMVGYIVAGLVIAGVLLTVAGYAYRWYAAKKGRELADALDLPQGVAA